MNAIGTHLVAKGSSISRCRPGHLGDRCLKPVILAPHPYVLRPLRVRVDIHQDGQLLGFSNPSRPSRMNVYNSHDMVRLGHAPQ